MDPLMIKRHLWWYHICMKFDQHRIRIHPQGFKWLQLIYDLSGCQVYWEFFRQCLQWSSMPAVRPAWTAMLNWDSLALPPTPPLQSPVFIFKFPYHIKWCSVHRDYILRLSGFFFFFESVASVCRLFGNICLLFKSIGYYFHLLFLFITFPFVEWVHHFQKQNDLE